jgi:3-oxoacyl-[acyl-carrier-protein] synthase III
MSVTRAVALGCGAYLPDRVVGNDEFARWLDTSDEWIRSRTGIVTRRFAAEGQTTSDLATEAARRALAAVGFEAAALDAVIVATATPDSTFPSTATRVRRGMCW